MQQASVSSGHSSPRRASAFLYLIFGLYKLEPAVDGLGPGEQQEPQI